MPFDEISRLLHAFDFDLLSNLSQSFKGIQKIFVHFFTILFFEEQTLDVLWKGIRTTGGASEGTPVKPPVDSCEVRRRTVQAGHLEGPLIFLRALFKTF